MTGPSVNLQDSFLNHVRKESIEVEVMLSNGTSLRGNVRGFDNFTVIMQVDGKQHLVYKHAIAQLIAPKFSRPPQASPRENGSQGDEAPRRQGPRNREPREAARAPAPPKFNSIDLSSLKIDQPPVGATPPQATVDSPSAPEA
jgi:host factor-I protein